jgi:hypothetical protein
MDSGSIVKIAIGLLGLIIGGGVIFQMHRKTKQTFADQKSKGAIGSHQTQAGGKVSIGETKVEIHGGLDKGK